VNVDVSVPDVQVMDPPVPEVGVEEEKQKQGEQEAASEGKWLAVCVELPKKRSQRARV
jgi:hypothetical protein